jgi:hypothetical protein
MRKRIVILLGLVVLFLGGIKAGQSFSVQTLSVVDYLGPAQAPGNPTAHKGRLYYDIGTSKLVCKNSDGSSCAPGGGGGGTPGGANTNVQYNDSGSFGGDANLTWNKGTHVLSIAGSQTITVPSQATTSMTMLNTSSPTGGLFFFVGDAGGGVIDLNSLGDGEINYDEDPSTGHAGKSLYILATSDVVLKPGNSGTGSVVPLQDNLINSGTATFRWKKSTSVSGAFTGLQIFANNAAAITGGLVAGDLYRTGADPDTVCVVH